MRKYAGSKALSQVFFENLGFTLLLSVRLFHYQEWILDKNLGKISRLAMPLSKNNILCVTNDTLAKVMEI
jgi:hypothetical protein